MNQMTIDIKLIEPPFSDEFINEFLHLSFLVFENHTDNFEEAIRWRLKNMPELKIFIAEEKGKMVGYKGGYAIAHDKYYSWLGGVHPDFRKQNIGKKLMEHQHQWLLGQPYRLVETHLSKIILR